MIHRAAPRHTERMNRGLAAGVKLVGCVENGCSTLPPCSGIRNTKPNPRHSTDSKPSFASNLSAFGHSQALHYILYSGHQLRLRYLQCSAKGRRPLTGWCRHRRLPHAHNLPACLADDKDQHRQTAQTNQQANSECHCLWGPDLAAQTYTHGIPSQHVQASRGRQ
jgi:hypothetical protein